MAERRLLIADDEADLRAPVRRFFEQRGFRVLQAESVAEAERVCRETLPDVALLDYSLPDGDGLELLRRLRQLDSSLPAIMLTGHGSIDLAVRAMQEGAAQFFTKPVELPALLVVVERALDHRRLQRVSEARQTRRARVGLNPFLGESPAMLKLAEQARRVAASSAPVLLMGETGCGKGVLARWLHENGPRSQEVFVDLNCAGLSRELLESELFGHQRGAFTGAVAAKQGLMELAHRGTLFLDEIGELDLAVQAKLLKAMEDLRFRRLGDVQDRQVDLRLIAATHRDLETLVREQKFREDLYYRMRGVPLYIPPLRERGPDVLMLARQFLERFGAELGRGEVRLTPDACALLEAHAWPGNVRELRNVIEQAVLLSHHDALAAADLREWLSPARSVKPAQRATLAAAERAHVAAMLDECDWVVPRAAEVLGISRTALYERIRKHDLKRSSPS